MNQPSPPPGGGTRSPRACRSARARRGVMGRIILQTAVIVVASAVLVAGCGRATISGQPRTLEAAVAAEQEKQDRGQAGDFAGEWLLFSKRVRDEISQADYVSYAKACYSTSNPVQVTGGRMEGDDKAVVRLELRGDQVSRTMVYEDGQWVQEPLDNWYERPLEQLIEECGSNPNEPTKPDTANDSSAPPLEPFQTTAELEQVFDEANKALAPCTNLPPSMCPASSIDDTVAKLRVLNSRLPDDYTETRIETRKQIELLERCSEEAVRTKSCPVIIIGMQLFGIAASWHQTRDDRGLN